jgi:hypothetical protein
MLNVFQHELQQEQAAKSSTSSKTSSNTSTKKASINNLPHLQNNFSNINENKVREAILSRHNDERDSL